MANNTRKRRKNVEASGHNVKRARESNDTSVEVTAGRIKRIFMKNFMCHSAMEIILNENVNFIVGRNGSGKSAILTALVVGLGAKASVTNRGSSIKEFVKKGKTSALVEITLVNQGPMAYKPDFYGDHIIVSRCIGSTSSYKIKNSKGEVISTKKDELDRIVNTMNIQVDNPISILNQDVSRTFLVTSTPKDKYDLFMKATQLDKIGSNYKQALISLEMARQQSKDHNESLATAKAEIDDLEKSLRMLESVDGVRAELNDLQDEQRWALAIMEEQELHRIEASLEEINNNVENHEEEMRTKETREKQIKAKIHDLREKIRELEAEAAGSSNAYAAAKQQFATKKETHSNKLRQWQSEVNKMHRLEDDVAKLRKEIQRLESEGGQAENELHQAREKLATYERKLAEVEDMMCTKRNDQMHLETEKSRLVQAEGSARMDLKQSEDIIRQKKRQILGLKQTSGNAMTVFGPNMPRLLKRIKEEYDRGRFKEMPCGPIGSYMKMKDRAWAPAVESFLGSNSLRSFCVDNSQDAKTLGLIMKEVFRDEPSPQIISSKFYNKVHNVGKNCTKAPEFSNLLDAMEISNPIVANCLIDQREVECVLLIPTSSKACEMMSDARKVPRNCKRALTQQGDTFFPDPNYRSYGGRAGMKARYLQVSTTDAIKVLEEELASAEEQQQAAAKQHQTIEEQLRRATSELSQVNGYVSKLQSNQRMIKTAINELRDKCEVTETNSVAVFIAEVEELQKKLAQRAVEEKKLKLEAAELQKEMETCEAEVKRFRELIHCLDAKLDPIKQQINEQENENQMLQVNSQYSERRLQAARQTLQKVTAKLEAQHRVTAQAVAEATKCCPRKETQRTPNEINRKVKELKASIDEVEQQFGNKELIEENLQGKKEKYDGLQEIAVDLEKNNKKQLKRLEMRRRLYQKMKKEIGVRVQHSFESVLSLRKYEGTLTIDHVNRVLQLEVNPESSAKKLNNDARSLSGGERSYSTVAFILALWDCIELPFYFLDEFDVFMDKVNRRVIMDILLDHTKSHPRNQFAFLTPLDTSNIMAEDYITIHQLASPERAGNSG